MKFRALILSLFTLTALAVTASAAEAKANWQEHCAKCHGKDGRGQTKDGKKFNVPDFSTKRVQNLFTDEQAFKIIKNGVKDDNNQGTMVAVEGLSDAEIKALVAYVRTLKK